MNMKKMSSKTAAILLTFAAAASMSAVTVGAADYGAPPDYAQPDTSAYTPGSAGGSSTAGSSTETTATDTEDEEDAEEEETTAETVSAPVILTSEVVTSAIEDAIASGESSVTIEMSANSSGNVTVQENTVAAIAASGVAVTIEVTPAEEGNLPYSVTIDPDMITDVSGNLNIGLDISKTDEMKTVKGGAYVPTNTVVITPSGDGDFGATLQVTLPSSALKGMKKSKVKLYAVDKNGNVTKIDDDAIILNDDGSVTVLIDNGDSQLVISDKNLVKANEKVKKLKEEKEEKSSKTSKTAKSSKAQSAAALGTADLAALSAVGVITQKKKKKK